MRKSLIGLVLALSLSYLPAFSANTPKAGSVCNKKGVTKTYKGKEFNCLKKGGKLVWSKGKVVKRETSVAAPEVTPSLAPSPTPTTTPTSTPTPTPTPTPNSSVSPNEKSNLMQSAEIAQVSECKIKDTNVSKQPAGSYNNIGFPITPHELPIIGNVKIALLPVSFRDIPGKSSVSSQLIEYSKKMNSWAQHFSNGKLSYDFSIHADWIELPENSTQFRIQPPSSPTYLVDQSKLANRIIEIADKTFDFKDVQAILIYWPEIPKTFEFDLGLRDFSMTSNEGSYSVFIWSPGPFMYSNIGTSSEIKRKRMWQFYLHEMLHSHGITGHAPAGFDTGVGNTIWGASSALDSWSLFLAGWTLDEQIYCAPRIKLNTSVVHLAAVDEIGVSGYRTIIIPISGSEAIVVEARKPVHFSEDWPDDSEGVFAFTVDTSKRNDPRNPLPSNSRKFESWAYFLPPTKLIKSGRDYEAIKCQDEVRQVGCSGLVNDFRDFLLTVGDHIEYAGIRIDLLEFKEKAIVKIYKTL